MRPSTIRVTLLLHVALLGLGSGAAHAQSVYRCESGGKVSYSDRPCSAGAERRVNVDGGPSREEQAAARVRLQQKLDAQAAREALARQRQVPEAEPADAGQPTGVPAIAADPRDNEKVMVHGPGGWDYKTRAQLRAEEEARATGRTPRATGAAWEQQRSLTHSGSGWSQKSGRQQVVDEAARARDRQQQQAARPMNPNVVNCDSGGCWGTDGTRYNRGAGNTMFGSDGRICQAVAPGAPLICN